MLLLFSLLWGIQISQGEDGCKEMSYLDCIKNKTMTGHAIKTSLVPVPGLQICQNNCFIEKKCVSYNLGPVDGTIRTCELNSADHWIKPDLLVTKEGFEYCPIENSCSSSPCPVGSLCAPDFEWGNHTCIACDLPLGMKNKDIKDNQITASSYSNYFEPHHGRLDNRHIHMVTWGSWTARNRAIGEWLQVDLLTEMMVIKVTTQGCPSHDYWVTSYTVIFSHDNIAWSQGMKTYSGNTNRNDVVTNTLVPPIKARYVRLVVKGFRGSPSLRMELYRCATN